MITKEEAMQLKHGDVIYHVSETNADGTPLRARITGKIKVLKRQPEVFRIPFKHGLRRYGELNNHNNSWWALSEARAVMEAPLINGERFSSVV